MSVIRSAKHSSDRLRELVRTCIVAELAAHPVKEGSTRMRYEVRWGEESERAGPPRPERDALPVIAQLFSGDVSLSLSLNIMISKQTSVCSLDRQISCNMSFLRRLPANSCLVVVQLILRLTRAKISYTFINQKLAKFVLFVRNCSCVIFSVSLSIWRAYKVVITKVNI